jgi:hypothetical protein
MSDVRTWHEDLHRVVTLNRAVKPAEAEELLRAVIRGCPRQELRVLSAETTAALQSFLPKRRRALEDLLRQGLADTLSSAPAAAEMAQEAAAQEATEQPAQCPPVRASAQRAADRREHVASMAPDPVTMAIREIARLNGAARPAEADASFRGILGTLSLNALAAREPELRRSLETFLPRRRNVLTQLLDAALDEGDDEPPAAAPQLQPQPRQPAPVVQPQPPAPVVQPQPPAPVVQPRPSVPAPLVQQAAVAPRTPAHTWGTSQSRPDIAYLGARFTSALDDLSDMHIFQWATFYRDVLSDYFEGFLDYLRTADKPNSLLHMVKAALSHHAHDIFRKGFQYSTTHNKANDRLAITKALAGLQRFLDLPLEFYSARLGEAHREGQALRLRQLCSAMVSGILTGYAQTKFDMLGSRVLPRFPRSWIHVLPFLVSGDLSELINTLESGDFTDGLQDSIMPLVRAIDVFLADQPELAPLPALSQYVEETRRIDVSLQVPPTLNTSRLFEIQCYMTEAFVHLHLIEDAAGRAVTAVVAPLRSDLRGQLASIERFSDLVVPTDASASGRLLEVLHHVVDQDSSTSPDRPITFNFAAVFPLENPFLIKFKHVYRLSVRRLMSSYERRNGVRLWCSVRRSGKTTACASDLDATTGNTVVIPQACSSAGVITNGDIFYKEVQQALESGQRLPVDFVTTAIAKCAPDRAIRDSRVVLILDEYETLFGDMRTSLDAREQLRYTVVQPLLDQLVAFTRDNLLIFMGQQPNAHFILMDQNQLSPVVEQDSFPLFTHDPLSRSTGEFYQLLQMVLSSHVELDDEFVTRINSETGGHPFLTVKLLVSFMDWLIQTRRPISVLAPLKAELFDDFASSNMNRVSILHNSHYAFFKGIAANHLSSADRARQPWLHSVYSALRNIALNSPSSLSMELDDFIAMIAPDCIATSPHELLATAQRANFLVLRDGYVRPMIPLLARIASAVTPL